MNNILSSLCITCLFFKLSDAVPLTLVPGDRRVVKQDGATHTISKYYVVPNDYNLNNGSETSLGAILLSNNNRYTKSMNLETVNQEDGAEAANDQLDEYRVAINNKRLNTVSDSGVAQDEAGYYEAAGNDAEARTTGNTEVNLESKNLGNIQVNPIINPYNENNMFTAENKTYYKDEDNNGESPIEINTAPNNNNYINDQQKVAMVTEFAAIVQAHAGQNLQSFWDVFKKYVDATSDVEEQLIRIEKLFLLLNMFTNLYKATQSQIPIDFIIDEIADILQTIIDPRNTDSTRNETPTLPYTHERIKIKTRKECIRKCYQVHSKKAKLDSNTVSISETEDRIPSDDIEPENVYLETYLTRSDSNAENDYLETYLTRSDSNAENEYILDQLAASDPDLNHVVDIDQPINIQTAELVNPNYLQTERKLIGVPDGYNTRFSILTPTQQLDEPENTAETSELPWPIEDKLVKKLPLTTEDSRNNPSWWIENKIKNPSWTITKKIYNPPRTYKHNIGTVPILYSSDGSALKISDDNILIDSNTNPVTSTVKEVSVKNVFGKPYLYTYVINPSKFLYRGPEVTYKGANSHVVHINEPSTGYHQSELSLSNEPKFVLNNEPNYYESQLNVKNDMNLLVNDIEANLRPQTLEHYYEPNIKLELEKETNMNPTILLPNTPSSESLINLELEQEYGVPIVQDISSNAEGLLLNVPSNSLQSHLNFDIEKDHRPKFIDETNTGINPGILVPDVQPYYQNSKVKVSVDKETDVNQILNPTVPSYESDFVKLDNEYNVLIPDYGEKIDTGAEILLSNQPAGYDVNFIQQPSAITSVHGNQQPEYDYLQHLKATLAPSYQLFSIENLLKLHNYLINSKQITGFNVYEDRALSNLRKIDNLLLILAEYVGANGSTNKWYENILYNARKPRHPLQMYVYNLLRQKWLHKLMLVLYRNNFNVNILNSPRLYAVLEALRFPNYVLNFLEAEELLNLNYETPYGFDETYGAHNVIPGNIATHNFNENLGTPQILENYDSDDIVDYYRPQNEDIILSMTGLDAGLDTNEIIYILKRYLRYKNYVENQENVINRGNRIEMFKQIVLYLSGKGYGDTIIDDLIRKLYRAVYLIEANGCSQIQYSDFMRNIYDIILPVLRRSGS